MQGDPNTQMQQGAPPAQQAPPMADEISQLVAMTEQLMQAGQMQQQRIDNLEKIIQGMQTSNKEVELELKQLQKSIEEAGSQMPDMAALQAPGAAPMHAGLPLQPGMPPDAQSVLVQ